MLLRSAFVLLAYALPAFAGDPWLTIPGGDGPGKGKKIVLVSGDEEYRSEEILPQMAKVLAKHHGFDCTVLFAIDPADGCIQPNVLDNIPGLEKLKDADLMVIFTRWRNLPDAQTKYIIDFVESGKPVVGLRTATHAFNFKGKSEYAKYTHNSKVPGYEGGFGRQVLGETWVNHHGLHGKQGTRGIVAKGAESNPILKGIAEGSVFGTTDVYTAKPLGEFQPLFLGAVTESLMPDSAIIAGPKNDPMMPVAWTKSYKGEKGTGRVFATTMGCGEDFAFEGTRRMLVNGCYWALGLEEKIPDKSNVDLVGEYKPTKFGTKKNEQWKPGVKPEDLR